MYYKNESIDVTFALCNSANIYIDYVLSCFVLKYILCLYDYKYFPVQGTA